MTAALRAPSTQHIKSPASVLLGATPVIGTSLHLSALFLSFFFFFLAGRAGRAFALGIVAGSRWYTRACQGSDVDSSFSRWRPASSDLYALRADRNWFVFQRISEECVLASL